MGYNVIDVINKAINVEIKREEIYENIAQQEDNLSSMKVLSKVLAKQVEKNIQYYKLIIKQIENTELQEIDFGIYDRISFLVNEFNEKMYSPQITNTREYLEFSLRLERDTLSLLIDVKGRFVKNISDTQTETYKILDDMIRNENSHIKIIEDTLK